MTAGTKGGILEAGNGDVQLVDWMGDDDAIVQSARVSYGKGTKSVSEDKALIRYLMRHKHLSPFEQVVFKFRIKCPILVARQFFRHRTFAYNEISLRYSEANEDFLITAPGEWRSQAQNNKQGSGDFLPTEIGSELCAAENDLQRLIWNIYLERLEKGVAREQARKDLPVSLSTEFYVTGSLRNWFNFLALRLDSHAQKEIRVVAEALAKHIEVICPNAYQAFLDYDVNGVRFSQNEMGVIGGFLRVIGGSVSESVLSGDNGLSEREKKELIDKLYPHLNE